MELLITLTREHLILLEPILSPIRESENVTDNDGLQSKNAAVSLLANEIVLRAAQNDDLHSRIEVLKRKNSIKTKQTPHTADDVKTSKKSVQTASKAIKKEQTQRKKAAAKKAKEAAKKAKDAAKLAAKKAKEETFLESAGKALFGTAPTK
jgi:hypothetical protein